MGVISSILLVICIIIYLVIGFFTSIFANDSGNKADPLYMLYVNICWLPILLISLTFNNVANILDYFNNIIHTRKKVKSAKKTKGQSNKRKKKNKKKNKQYKCKNKKA